MSRAALRASLKNAKKKTPILYVTFASLTDFGREWRRASSQRAALHDSVRTFSPSLSTDDFTPKGEKELGRSLYWLCQPFICYPGVNYSRPPIIRTFKGNRKKFKLSGVRVIEGSSYLPGFHCSTILSLRQSSWCWYSKKPPPSGFVIVKYEGLPANDFLLNYATSLTIITEKTILGNSDLCACFLRIVTQKCTLLIEKKNRWILGRLLSPCTTR